MLRPEPCSRCKTGKCYNDGDGWHCITCAYVEYHPLTSSTTDYHNIPNLRNPRGRPRKYSREEVAVSLGQV